MNLPGPPPKINLRIKPKRGVGSLLEGINFPGKPLKPAKTKEEEKEKLLKVETEASAIAQEEQAEQLDPGFTEAPESEEATVDPNVRTRIRPNLQPAVEILPNDMFFGSTVGRAPLENQSLLEPTKAKYKHPNPAGESLLETFAGLGKQQERNPGDEAVYRSKQLDFYISSAEASERERDRIRDYNHQLMLDKFGPAYMEHRYNYIPVDKVEDIEGIEAYISKTKLSRHQENLKEQYEAQQQQRDATPEHLKTLFEVSKASSSNGLANFSFGLTPVPKALRNISKREPLSTAQAIATGAALLRKGTTNDQVIEYIFGDPKEQTQGIAGYTDRHSNQFIFNPQVLEMYFQRTGIENTAEARREAFSNLVAYMDVVFHLKNTLDTDEIIEYNELLNRFDKVEVKGMNELELAQYIITEGWLPGTPVEDLRFDNAGKTNLWTKVRDDLAISSYNRGLEEYANHLGYNMMMEANHELASATVERLRRTIGLEVRKPPEHLKGEEREKWYINEIAGVKSLAHPEPVNSKGEVIPYWYPRRWGYELSNMINFLKPHMERAAAVAGAGHVGKLASSYLSHQVRSGRIARPDLLDWIGIPAVALRSKAFTVTFMASLHKEMAGMLYKDMAAIEIPLYYNSKNTDLQGNVIQTVENQLSEAEALELGIEPTMVSLNQTIVPYLTSNIGAAGLVVMEHAILKIASRLFRGISSTQRSKWYNPDGTLKRNPLTSPILLSLAWVAKEGGFRRALRIGAGGGVTVTWSSIMEGIQEMAEEMTVAVGRELQNLEAKWMLGDFGESWAGTSIPGIAGRSTLELGKTEDKLDKYVTQVGDDGQPLGPWAGSRSVMHDLDFGRAFVEGFLMSFVSLGLANAGGSFVRYYADAKTGTDINKRASLRIATQQGEIEANRRSRIFQFPAERRISTTDIEGTKTIMSPIKDLQVEGDIDRDQVEMWKEKINQAKGLEQALIPAIKVVYLSPEATEKARVLAEEQRKIQDVEADKETLEDIEKREIDLERESSFVAMEDHKELVIAYQEMGEFVETPIQIESYGMLAYSDAADILKNTHDNRRIIGVPERINRARTVIGKTEEEIDKDPNTNAELKEYAKQRREAARVLVQGRFQSSDPKKPIIKVYERREPALKRTEYTSALQKNHTEISNLINAIKPSYYQMLSNQDSTKGQNLLIAVEKAASAYKEWIEAENLRDINRGRSERGLAVEGVPFDVQDKIKDQIRKVYERFEKESKELEDVIGTDNVLTQRLDYGEGDFHKRLIDQLKLSEKYLTRASETDGRLLYDGELTGFLITSYMPGENGVNVREVTWEEDDIQDVVDSISGLATESGRRIGDETYKFYKQTVVTEGDVIPGTPEAQIEEVTSLMRQVAANKVEVTRKEDDDRIAGMDPYIDYKNIPTSRGEAVLGPKGQTIRTFSLIKNKAEKENLLEKTENEKYDTLISLVDSRKPKILFNAAGRLDLEGSFETEEGVMPDEPKIGDWATEGITDPQDRMYVYTNINTQRIAWEPTQKIKEELRALDVTDEEIESINTVADTKDQLGDRAELKAVKNHIRNGLRVLALKERGIIKALPPIKVRGDGNDLEWESGHYNIFFAARLLYQSAKVRSKPIPVWVNPFDNDRQTNVTYNDVLNYEHHQSVRNNTEGRIHTEIATTDGRFIINNETRVSLTNWIKFLGAYKLAMITEAQDTSIESYNFSSKFWGLIEQITHKTVSDITDNDLKRLAREMNKPQKEKESPGFSTYRKAYNRFLKMDSPSMQAYIDNATAKNETISIEDIPLSRETAPVEEQIEEDYDILRENRWIIGWTAGKDIAGTNALHMQTQSQALNASLNGTIASWMDGSGPIKNTNIKKNKKAVKAGAVPEREIKNAEQKLERIKVRPDVQRVYERKFQVKNPIRIKYLKPNNYTDGYINAHDLFVAINTDSRVSKAMDKAIRKTTVTDIDLSRETRDVTEKQTWKQFLSETLGTANMGSFNKSLDTENSRIAFKGRNQAGLNSLFRVLRQLGFDSIVYSANDIEIKYPDAKDRPFRDVNGNVDVPNEAAKQYINNRSRWLARMSTVLGKGLKEIVNKTRGSGLIEEIESIINKPAKKAAKEIIKPLDPNAVSSLNIKSAKKKPKTIPEGADDDLVKSNHEIIRNQPVAKGSNGEDKISLRIESLLRDDINNYKVAGGPLEIAIAKKEAKQIGYMIEPSKLGTAKIRQAKEAITTLKNKIILLEDRIKKEKKDPDTKEEYIDKLKTTINEHEEEIRQHTDLMESSWEAAPKYEFKTDKNGDKRIHWGTLKEAKEFYRPSVHFKTKEEAEKAINQKQFKSKKWGDVKIERVMHHVVKSVVRPEIEEKSLIADGEVKEIRYPHRRDLLGKPIQGEMSVTGIRETLPPQVEYAEEVKGYRILIRPDTKIDNDNLSWLKEFVKYKNSRILQEISQDETERGMEKATMQRILAHEINKEMSNLDSIALNRYKGFVLGWRGYARRGEALEEFGSVVENVVVKLKHWLINNVKRTDLFNISERRTNVDYRFLDRRAQKDNPKAPYISDGYMKFWNNYAKLVEEVMVPLKQLHDDWGIKESEALEDFENRQFQEKYYELKDIVRKRLSLEEFDETYPVGELQKRYGMMGKFKLTAKEGFKINERVKNRERNKVLASVYRSTQDMAFYFNNFVDNDIKKIIGELKREDLQANLTNEQIKNRLEKRAVSNLENKYGKNYTKNNLIEELVNRDVEHKPGEKKESLLKKYVENESITRRTAFEQAKAEMENEIQADKEFNTLIEIAKLNNIPVGNLEVLYNNIKRRKYDVSEEEIARATETRRQEEIQIKKEDRIDDEETGKLDISATMALMGDTRTGEAVIQESDIPGASGLASARTNLNTPGADFTLTMEKDDTLETATVQEIVQESYETSRDIEVRGSKIIPAVKPEEETFTATIKGEEGFLTEEEKEIRERLTAPGRARPKEEKTDDWNDLNYKFDVPEKEQKKVQRLKERIWAEAIEQKELSQQEVDFVRELDIIQFRNLVHEFRAHREKNRDAKRKKFIEEYLNKNPNERLNIMGSRRHNTPYMTAYRLLKQRTRLSGRSGNWVRHLRDGAMNMSNSYVSRQAADAIARTERATELPIEETVEVEQQIKEEDQVTEAMTATEAKEIAADLTDKVIADLPDTKQGLKLLRQIFGKDQETAEAIIEKEGFLEEIFDEGIEKKSIGQIKELMESIRTVLNVLVHFSSNDETKRTVAAIEGELLQLMNLEVGLRKDFENYRKEYELEKQRKEAEAKIIKEANIQSRVLNEMTTNVIVLDAFGPKVRASTDPVTNLTTRHSETLVNADSSQWSGTSKHMFDNITADTTLLEVSNLLKTRGLLYSFGADVNWNTVSNHELIQADMDRFPDFEEEKTIDKLKEQFNVRALTDFQSREEALTAMQKRRESDDLRNLVNAQREYWNVLSEISTKREQSITGFYAEAIRHLQRGIDQNFFKNTRSSRTPEHNEESQKFINRHMFHKHTPKRLLSKLAEKDLQNWSIRELEDLRDTIQKLERVGNYQYYKETSELNNQRDAQNKAIVERFQEFWESLPPRLRGAAREDIGLHNLKLGADGISPASLPRTVLTWLFSHRWANLRATRWSDKLNAKKYNPVLGSGTAEFKGLAYDLFVNEPREAQNRYNKAMETRRDSVLGAFKSLGLKHKDIAKNFNKIYEERYNESLVDGSGREMNLSMDDAIAIYALNKVDYGRVSLEHGKLINEELQNKIISAIPEEWKKVAIVILEDYKKVVPELNNARLLFENKPYFSRPGYHIPLLRFKKIESAGAIGPQDVNKMSAQNIFNTGDSSMGFILNFMDNPTEENRQLLRPNAEPRLGLMTTWYSTMQHQERYINMWGIWAKLKAIFENDTGNLEFQTWLRKAHGQHAVHIVKRFIERVGRGGYSPIENEDAYQEMFRVMRQNLGFTVLAGNFSTAIKQAPSLAFYLGEASTGHVLQSLLDMADPDNVANVWNFVRENDISIKERNISRDLDDLRKGDFSLYSRLKKKIGSIGMSMIYGIDASVVTAGWWAVYNDRISNGLTHEEAVRDASGATVRTQPASHIFDVAERYDTNNEFLRSILLFTNQLSNIWNMATYDMPKRLLTGDRTFNERITYGGGTFISLGLSAFVMYMIAYRELPDDEEDWKNFLTMTIFSPMPISGRMITNAMSGYDPIEVNASEAITKMYRILKDPSIFGREAGFADYTYVLGLATGAIPAEFLTRLNRVRTGEDASLVLLGSQRGK